MEGDHFSHIICCWNCFGLFSLICPLGIHLFVELFGVLCVSLLLQLVAFSNHKILLCFNHELFFRDADWWTTNYHFAAKDCNSQESRLLDGGTYFLLHSRSRVAWTVQSRFPSFIIFWIRNLKTFKQFLWWLHKASLSFDSILLPVMTILVYETFGLTFCYICAFSYVMSPLFILFTSWY